MCVICVFFFFQAEDGIRDAQESRGLGDVYKRQWLRRELILLKQEKGLKPVLLEGQEWAADEALLVGLSLIHI